jgi:hypothetical protein
MDRRFECRSGAFGARGCAFLLAAAALSACGGHAGQNSSSPPSPAAAKSYATGSGPPSVAIGDLNGDRKPDLATANRDASTVSVLLNRGDGSFRPKRNYATGRHPDSVAIGDLNGDGKPDLATANYGGWSVSVLPNQGDGTFQAKLDYYVTGSSPRSVAIADLNGDRKRDLATNGVSVLLNRPGLCTVQDVWRQTVPAAKRTLAHANCRVGKIRRVYSGAYSKVKRGGVISQKPNFGAVLRGGAKVDLVVSLGRRR